MGGLDAAFLSLETGATRLHVAAVLVLDPPEGRRSLYSPSTRYAQVRALVAERLPLVARLRQRAVRVPLGLHHPVWADDPEFDLDDHLSRASLPAPGGPRELDTLVAEVMSRPLDPDRPLWEMVVVEGLAHGRSAVVAKLHHAILDGVSGASVLAAFLDLGPRARPAPPAEPWAPDPLPSQADLLRHAAAGALHQPGQVAEAVQRAMLAVADVGAQNRQLASRGEEPPPSPFRAPRTSLNGTVSSRRRYASVAVPLDDLKLVRRVFGTTVNDVVLASVGAALRRLLAARGEWPHDPLVAMVPVSTRALGAGLDLGNQVSGMLVSLATDVADPVERLRAVSAAARVAKEQERLLGGPVFDGVAQVALPALASRVMRWATGLRLFDRVPPVANVTVSNVPGPAATLWLAGAPVSSVLPVGPVPEGIGLNVTAMSYGGQVVLGLLACRRMLPELGDLAIMVDDAVAELVAGALDHQRRAG